ncbi:MAG: mechanosensitive ion channel family protein [Haloarculaceae archaeon]
MIPLLRRVAWVTQTATPTPTQEPTPTPLPTPTPTPDGAVGAAGTQFTPENVLTAVVVLVVAYVLASTLSLVLSKLADRLAARRFRVMFLIPIVKFVVYGGALYLVLSVLFDLTETQVVAFAGLFGAALGLGLKDLLADIVGGVVVVLEQPFQVGDKVQLGEYYGEVVDIGVRSTTLVTPNDTLVAVPNFALFNDSVANANTSDAEMLVVVDFYIDPDSDVERATEIVEDALVTSPYVFVADEAPATVVVEDDLYYRTVTGKAYVNDLRSEMAFKTDVTERVLDAFDEAGIESPTASADVPEG